MTAVLIPSAGIVEDMYARRDFPLSSVLKIVAEGCNQTGKRKTQTRGEKITSKHILKSEMENDDFMNVLLGTCHPSDI